MTPRPSAYPDKKSFWAAFVPLAVFLILGAVLPASAQDFTEERIARFHAAVTVNPDSSIEVVEEIVAEFPEERHGIYRNIPVVYRSSFGNLVRIRLTVDQVTDGEGTPIRYEQSRDGGELVLKIGDPDRTIIGEQRYRISYHVRRALLYFEDHDELYWNASGDDWDLPLGTVTASVGLPEGVPTDKITSSCYTGAEGSTETDCTIAEGEGLLVFGAAGPLTIAVGWPKGFVKEPTACEDRMNFLFDNLGLLVPILVFIAMFWVWWTRGRDPKTGTIMAEYEPPDKMRPAELDALKDEAVGSEAISATVVDLAVRGYLQIIESESGFSVFKSRSFTLKRQKEVDDGLDPLEHRLFDALFATGDTRTLDSLKSNTGFMAARKAFQDDVLKGLVTKGYFAGNPSVIKGAYIATGVVLGVLLGFFGAGIAAWFGTGTVIGLVVSVFLIIIFGLFMPRRTPKGAEAFHKAKGFKLYLSMAEKYRLEWQEKEKMFEMFLPYAMIFGVVGAWVAAMKTLGIAAPTWYVGATPGVFDADAFSSSINSFSSNAAASMAPSSSGSSGGGHSGGGFGGGGGGSW